MSGIIYVLTNPAMVGYVKVGRTNNLVQRMKDLDNTSAPLPFQCIYAIKVDDPVTVESRIHDTFADRRTRSTREFFEVNPERIISALQLTNGEDVTPGSEIEDDAESQRALRRTNKIRSAFNFSMVNIPPGTILTFIRDSSQTCEVKSDRTVIFQGEETSLSASALTLLQKSGWKSDQAHGTLYWCLDGESMSERRNRMEIGDQLG